MLTVILISLPLSIALFALVLSGLLYTAIAIDKILEIRRDILWKRAITKNAETPRNSYLENTVCVHIRPVFDPESNQMVEVVQGHWHDRSNRRLVPIHEVHPLI